MPFDPLIPKQQKTMKPKTLKITYWVLISLFALLMLADGIAGIAHQKDGQEAFRQLGYPMYLMTIIGTAKILGAIGLLQPTVSTLKEWAFAGFTFNFLGASASWAFVGKQPANVVFPLIMLAVLLLVYGLWKKAELTNNVLRFN